MAVAWNEGRIGRILARGTFKGNLCVLPNCVWTGDEIDLLVVTPSRRIIDVEVKITRADLKADASKGKWWHREGFGYFDAAGHHVRPPRVALPWPRCVWKHYYAMPAEVWRVDLLTCVQPNSGILLVRESDYRTRSVECIKRAKPCRNAAQITDDQVVEIARLASLRMWDAYAALDAAREAAG